MRTRLSLIILALFFIGVFGAAAWYVTSHDIAILNPHGEIAQHQFDLIRFTVILSIIIVVPVFGLTFFIVWRYREGNSKAAYTPNWHGSRQAEVIWWVIPLLLITVLAVVAWQSSHRLDPYRAIDSTKKPLRVQVVALQWKWLFIYPEQHIATVNYLRVPENTPLNFEITADAPMNSFWVPKLGGQVYAMSGMSTQLHLMADGLGTYQGSSANLSGEGFAGMKFTVTSTSRTDFDTWVKTLKTSRHHLDQNSYSELAAPSKNVAPLSYGSSDPALYDTVIKKYTTPRQNESETTHTMSAMPGGEN